MQWLIDIIYDAMVAAGFLTASYVDRGDPPNPDFAFVHFTKDGNWHDRDLSGIIPEGAIAAHLILTAKNSGVEKLFAVRKNGNSSAVAISSLLTQVSNVAIRSDVIVALDSNRTIEYQLSVGGWTSIYLTVRGWWL